MKKPDFYSQTFIACHGAGRKSYPKDCLTQCHDCMDVIIDYHISKKDFNCKPSTKKQTQTL